VIEQRARLRSVAEKNFECERIKSAREWVKGARGGFYSNAEGLNLDVDGLNPFPGRDRPVNNGRRACAASFLLGMMKVIRRSKTEESS
jgi:hypothetical protein